MFLAPVGVVSPHPALAQDFERVAPYQDMVWPEETPERHRVLVDGAWFELLSIDGKVVADIVAASRAAFGDLWQKRFDEDLFGVLATMGSPPGRTVALGLRNAETGESFTLDAEMTSANRASLMRTKWAREPPGITIIPDPPPEALSGAEISDDLDALLAEMEARWAYLRATEVDYLTVIAGLKERGANGMAHTDYGIEVLRIVSMFIDGHTTVRGFRYPEGELPFLIEGTADRFVAIRPDRTGFVNPDRAYLTRIDGRPIEAWLDSATAYVSKGSSQWRRRNELDLVEQIGFMRKVIGMPPSDSVEIEVTSEDPADTRRLTLVTVDDPALAGDHLGGSRFMYRESWTGWSPEERAAIARFRDETDEEILLNLRTRTNRTRAVRVPGTRTLSLPG